MLKIKNNKKEQKLYFGFGNAKLSDYTATFSIPAGYSCNFAHECFSRADRNTGKIQDGKHTKFRCFAASQEALYKTVRDSRWRNYNLLKTAKTTEEQEKLIQNSFPNGSGTIRVHVSGDFFSESYFLAWLNVAKKNPDSVFYGYTKCLPFLVKYKDQIPKNFRFTASMGGKADNLIKKHKLKYAEVVFSHKEAFDKKLEIDHNDSLAVKNKKSFGLLLHGKQAVKTAAALAMSKLRKLGWSGYGIKK